MLGRCAAATKKIYELLKSDKNQQKKDFLQQQQESRGLEIFIEDEF